MTAAGRVVWVIDEPGRYGFAYGTLPGHPEQGEESFVVVRQGDRLVFEITAFSRPRHWLARLGGPVTRMVQRHATRRYLAVIPNSMITDDFLALYSRESSVIMEVGPPASEVGGGELVSLGGAG